MTTTRRMATRNGRHVIMRDVKTTTPPSTTKKKDVDMTTQKMKEVREMNENDLFVCVATGPSIIQKNIDLLYQHKNDMTVICVNDAWKLRPSDNANCFIGDHLYAADPPWWKIHIDEIRNSGFAGEMWIPLNKNVAEKHGINYVPFESKPGLGKNGKVHSGSHSGYQAINLAYLLGARRIILLGYDMNVKDKNMVHFFGNHPKGLRNTPNAYSKWIKNYKQLSEELSKEGVDVINCNKDSAIPYFEKRELKDVL